MNVEKSLKGAAKRVKATTKRVVRKTEMALKPVGDAVTTETKAIKKVVQQGAEKAGQSLESLTEVFGSGDQARKPTTRTKRASAAKKSTNKKAR